LFIVIIQYQKMAEKIRINLSNGKTKSSDEQFLKAPRNWQKCSALVNYDIQQPYNISSKFYILN
jgi:hypothetical protein